MSLRRLRRICNQYSDVIWFIMNVFKKSDEMRGVGETCGLPRANAVRPYIVIYDYNNKMLEEIYWTEF